MTAKIQRGMRRKPDLETVYSINADGSRNMLQPADVRGRWHKRRNWIFLALIAFYEGGTRYRCTATLVNPTTMITAAHCTQTSGYTLVTFDSFISDGPTSGLPVASVPNDGYSVSDIESAGLSGARLRYGVAAQRCSVHAGAGNNVTLSFGLTALLPGDGPQALMKRADVALYLAKNKGRNRVVAEAA